MSGKRLLLQPLPPLRQSGARAYQGAHWRDPVHFDIGYFRGIPAAVSGVSTPDDASLDITGNIDVRALIALENWASILQRIVGKREGAADRSWSFYIASTGKLGWNWSVDGTGATGGFNESSTSPGVNDQHLWIRVTHQVNDGAGQNVVTFFTSTQPITTHPADVVWTLLSQHTNSGATSIFNSTAALQVGNNDGNELTGRAYYAEVRNSIDGNIVANPDFRYRTDFNSPTQLTDQLGKVWTINAPGYWVLPFMGAEPTYVPPPPYEYHRHRPRLVSVRY